MALRRDRDEDLEDILNKGALWAVTYGDLMSYLMIFFLVLFAASVSGETRLAPGLAAVQSQFGGTEAGLARQRRRERELGVAEDMATRLHSRGLQKFASVEVTQRRIQVTLREPVLFDSGRAALKASASPMLHEFAEAARGLPNRVVVEGHTDDVPVAGGAYRSNWDLSMARAAAVIERLALREGLDPSRLSGAGYAEFRPAAPNGTAEGRAKNRRIELSILREED